MTVETLLFVIAVAQLFIALAQIAVVRLLAKLLRALGW